MKISIIGVSGHGYTAVEGVGQNPAMAGEIVSIAPGSPGESISGFLSWVERAGHKPLLFDDWQQMLMQCQPDIVVVNPHFNDHEAISLAVIAQGRHLFSEKPLALSLAGLERIKKAYLSSNVELSAMLNMRYEPAMRAAWHAIRSGIIGDVRSLHVQKSYKLGVRPEFYKNRATFGGLIPWVGCHGVDMIAFLSGKQFLGVSAVSSSKANRDHGDLETSASMLFRLSEEVIATAQIDYFRPESASGHDDDRARVVGTKGIVEVRDGQCFLLGGAPEQNNGQKVAPVLELAPVYSASLFADFMGQCAGVGRCDVTAEDALENTRISLIVRDSADTGQQYQL